MKRVIPSLTAASISPCVLMRALLVNDADWTDRREAFRQRVPS
jgi:hypothetical protein